ncbi:MAG: DUF2076 domain-containing protein [Proteobacteria bacterium]|nr:DUF2076 domain-containing protein [Pseudomonadota bacterium]
MTPQERQRVSELFERLATLERVQRDADAEAAIAAGLFRAPNAAYALVQTVLVQDEALMRAEARIRELEGDAGAADRPAGGFLDTMRDTIFGSRAQSRGSVPNVPSAPAPMGAPPVFQGGAGNPAPAPESANRGGSFLGTAAAAAAGAIGGAMLFDGIRSMLGHQTGAQAGPARGALDQDGGASRSPWGSAGGGELARDAGLGDIARGSDGGGGGRSASLFDTNSDNTAEVTDTDFDVDFDDPDTV